MGGFSLADYSDGYLRVTQFGRGFGVHFGNVLATGYLGADRGVSGAGAEKKDVNASACLATSAWDRWV